MMTVIKMNANGFNTLGLLDQPLIRPPSGNRVIIMEGAGRPNELEYPDGLTINKVTPGVIKTTTAGLPDSIGVARRTNFVMNKNIHPGLKEQYSDIYFAAVPPVEKPSVQHLKTNTQLLMEMNTYEDGTRKHQVPSTHDSTRARHLRIYRDLIDQSSRSGLDPQLALERQKEANEYLLVNDPSLFQAVMNDRMHGPHQRIPIVPTDEKEIQEAATGLRLTPKEHQQKAEMEQKEIIDELNNLPALLSSPVKELIDEFEGVIRKPSREKVIDAFEKSTKVRNEMDELKARKLVSSNDVAAASKMIGILERRFVEAEEDLTKTILEEKEEAEEIETRLKRVRDEKDLEEKGEDEFPASESYRLATMRMIRRGAKYDQMISDINALLTKKIGVSDEFRSPEEKNDFIVELVETVAKQFEAEGEEADALREYVFEIIKFKRKKSTMKKATIKALRGDMKIFMEKK